MARSSDFMSISEPLSPPHPDENPNSAWSNIAAEQLRLLDEVQERWTDLKQREAALQLEQERWAHWRAHEEDQLERLRSETSSWIAAEDQRLQQAREAFNAERRAWVCEKTQHEQSLVSALNELRKEGLVHTELTRRRELKEAFCRAESDSVAGESVASLRRQLNSLRRTLHVKDTELRRLRRENVESKGHRGRCLTKPHVSHGNQQRYKPKSKSPIISSSDPETREIQSSSPSTPKVLEEKAKKAKKVLKADSAPVEQVNSPTLKVRHTQSPENHSLSIFWQGTGHPRSSSCRQLLPASHVKRLDGRHSPGRPRLPFQDNLVSREALIGPKFETSFARNATVDLGDLRNMRPPLSSNTTDDEPRITRNRRRRASDILAGIRSPDRSAHERGRPPASDENSDTDDEARFKRLEEGLRRVHQR